MNSLYIAGVVITFKLGLAVALPLSKVDYRMLYINNSYIM